ncbi:hypothetical protein DFH06DRAFT_355025 [Mycena polygramma]|nr:hypothetical protein DFH06DRAFT_355025 [Mycena polygramma]
MTNEVHRACLFLVYQPRIQASLDRARDGWNHHGIRTERNKTLLALYEISREAAMRRGYWTGDPGDEPESVANDPLYGYDGEAALPPARESNDVEDTIFVIVSETLAQSAVAPVSIVFFESR